MEPTVTIEATAEARAERLRASVRQLLTEARRGKRRPSYVDLLALHSLCAERGLYDAAADIRAYVATAEHLTTVKPLGAR